MTRASHHGDLKTTTLSSSVSEARRTADALLNHLLDARESSEQREVESGHCDPLRTVTGMTALDNAIRATHDMIGSIDQATRELADTAATAS